MTKLTTRIATALLLGVLCAAPAFAKAKSRLLTVGQDFVVGATTVKAGTYVFSVDSESNELTVLDKKTKAVIARAQTQAQSRGKGPFRLDFQLVDNNGTTARRTPTPSPAPPRPPAERPERTSCRSA
jgi:YVTN family beta-propeller protein